MRVPAVVALNCRLCPVGSGVLTVIGCRPPVLPGVLTVSLGDGPVAADPEALFLRV